MGIHTPECRHSYWLYDYVFIGCIRECHQKGNYVNFQCHSLETMQEQCKYYVQYIFGLFCTYVYTLYTTSMILCIFSIVRA